jgi:hypothetical protein
MRIAFANAGRVDTHLIVKDYTFEQFGLRLSTPKVGKKDGSYYIRGGDLIAPTRADENLRTAEIAIIDGDSSFDPETGEIVPGAPPFDDAIAALDDIGVSYIIHTSYSARPADGFWKYRIILPIQTHSVEELQAVVAHMLEQLHARGVFIADVRENGVWSQPWYLPRVASADDLPAFRSHTFEGRAIEGDEVESIAAAHKKRRAKDETIVSQPPVSKSLREADSPIRQFNEQHGLDWIRSALSSQGYKFGYVDRDRSYRYMRPGSESKTFGLKVFQGKFGDWCTYSHHGAADPLSGKVFDAFAVFATFQHRGDLKAAARSLMPPVLTMAEKIREQAIVLPAKPAPHEYVYTGDYAEPAQQAEPAKPAKPEMFDTTPEPAAAKVRIDIVDWQDLQDVSVTWLVKRMIPARGMTAIFGESGAGKSFFAIYVAAMIAAGQQAFGEDVDQGDVVYIAMEGAAGLRRRRDALIRTYDLPEKLPVHFIRQQLNLRSTLDDANALIAVIRAKGIKVRALIIDTLARAFAGGEENSAAEMSQFVAVLGYIEEQLQCAVLPIHHSGKDESRGMRGSSALRAACDAEIKIVRMSSDEDVEPVCQATTTKQKDGMDEIKWTFRLSLIQTSDIDLDATSLVVEPIENEQAPSRQMKPRKLSLNQRRAVDALQKAIAERGEYVGLDGIPAGQKVVHVTTWSPYFVVEYVGEDESARRKFKTAVDGLKERRTVCNVGKYYWISIG